MRHALILVLVFLGAAAHAQPGEPPRSIAQSAKSADKAEKPAPQRVIEITRSTKTNCDVKPVMTDDEIARCKKAWNR